MRIGDHRARQFRREDFDRFDWILAMDESNRDAILGLAAGPQGAGKVDLVDGPGSGVPDPAFGRMRDFERVFAQLDVAADRVVRQIAARFELP